MKPEYTVACPRCGAAKTKPCSSVRGNWMNPHSERAALVLEAWRLGYADGIAAWADLLDRLEQSASGLRSDVDFIRRSVTERIEADR